MTNNEIKRTVKLDETNRRYLHVEFKDMPEITEKVRQDNSKRFFTGGVRINNGLYWTDKEYDEYVNSVLQEELP